LGLVIRFQRDLFWDRKDPSSPASVFQGQGK